MAQKKEKTAVVVPKEEQPYEVPENWLWVRLESVCEYMRAGGDKPQIISDKKTDVYSIPIIANSLQNDGIIGYTNIIKEKAGTVTVSGRGSVGHSVFREYPYFPIIRLIVLSPNNAIMSIYLKYIFDYFEEKGTGTSIPQLTVPALKNKAIPLPPLHEQQRIVNIIESLFKNLDEAKEKLSKVKKGFGERKAALLHKAFTGELTAKWRERNGLGIDSWENAPLETAFNIKSGSTINQTDELDTGNIPYIKVADMNIPENSIQIVTSSRFVNSCSSNQIIPFGSTIFPKRGGAILTNKKRLVGVDKIIADLNVMAIIPIIERIDKWYGYYWMLSIDLRTINNGSNVPQINNKDMIKLFIPLPTLPEQKEIVSILDAVLSAEKEAEQKVDSVIDGIDLLKKSILARAFRGELGTNDPMEEKAI